MAVVYRGHDTVLKREVAVKVLHHHLAEHREARERFGREAEAVAKLRHENILEIHDFSGLDSDETYIVTEFIDGCTLKEFITDNALRFPEIGAMITSQVCKALAHAHGLGVLHRDVKPENIMIRSDGVVKLTDFGIAQMIDLQRMTVTGQLLGSPAYMSPEHVEGGNLDFRTDVFAVGIVLYQLVTGELPFNGKNPHEILKRIADCEFPEATRVNPRVGRELGAIIAKALQRSADDRFADISLMQQALDRFLEGSGIQSSKEELARFFDAPAAYQMALEKRLVHHLAERGKKLTGSDRVGALELFNRVLSIDEHNEEVLEYLHKLGARQRNQRIAMAVLATMLLAGLAVVAKVRFASRAAARSDLAWDAAIAEDAQSPAEDASTPDAARVPADAGTPSLVLADAAETEEVEPLIRRKKIDAGALVDDPPLAKRSFSLKLSPRGSEYRIGAGSWIALSSGSADISVPAGEQEIWARNESCCEETRYVVPADRNGGVVAINLGYLPAQVIPRCEIANVRVKINGRPAVLGRSATIPITRLVGTEVVRIAFFSEDRVDERSVTVGAKKVVEHECKF